MRRDLGHALGGAFGVRRRGGGGLGNGYGAEEGAVELGVVEVDAGAGAVCAGGAEELTREGNGG